MGKRQPHRALLVVVGLAILVSGCGLQSELDKTRQLMRMNDLRNVGLAMMQYVMEHGVYPPPSIVNEQGQPLLSWRVAMLPYLGHQALYNSFKLEEPWDSEHNLKLLKAMPAVFNYEGGTTTRYQVFVGDGAPFDVNRETIVPTDDVEWTILLVETAPDKAVPWTKPADVAFDPNDPAKALGQFPAEGALAVTFDYRVKDLPANLAPEVLKAMVTPTGQEAVEVFPVD